MAHDIIPGDVILYPWGITRELNIVTVHDVHVYDTGALGIRYSFTSNPRSIDWSGFIEADDPDIQLLSRGVAAARSTIRSLLP